MIRPEMIPDEVVEAAAKAVLEHSSGMQDPPMSDLQMRRTLMSTRIAIAAALNAWPGVRMMVDIDTGDDSALKLPLPEAPQERGVSTENSDE